MALTLQNLRAETPGVQPASLSPGQLCFNVADKIMFVGDGSDFKTPFGSPPVPGSPGEGWFSVPLTFSDIGDFYVIDPSFYGDIPIDGEVLTWDADLRRVVWSENTASTVYLVSNAEVAAAPGPDLTTKISNAIGATPLIGDSVIVTGQSEDTYQAFYQYIAGDWVFASAYAPPLASQVPISPIAGILASNVQEALEEIQNTAEAAQTTASIAVTVANNALPKSGGTMEGEIGFSNGQPVDAGTF